MKKRNVDVETVSRILSKALKMIIPKLEDEWTIDRESLVYQGKGTRCMMIRRDDSSQGMYLVTDIVKGFSLDHDKVDFAMKCMNDNIAQWIDKERRNDAERGVAKRTPHGFLAVDDEDNVYMVSWKMLHPFNPKEEKERNALVRRLIAGSRRQFGTGWKLILPASIINVNRSIIYAGRIVDRKSPYPFMTGEKAGDTRVVKAILLKKIRKTGRIGADEQYRKKKVNDIATACRDRMDRLQSIENSNIITYLGYDISVFESEENIYIYLFVKMKRYEVLSDYMQSHNLSERDVIRIGIDICRALEACEKDGIMHCDIKPENIFVERDGESVNYVLGDFDAYVTDNGKMTPEFAAPEQSGEIHEPLKPYTDVYLLGMTLYTLIGGKPQSRNRDGLPEVPTAGIELNEIIAKACKCSCFERYQSARGLRSKLERIYEVTLESARLNPWSALSENERRVFVRLKIIWEGIMRNGPVFEGIENSFELQENGEVVASIKYLIDGKSRVFHWQFNIVDFSSLLDGRGNDPFQAMEKVSAEIYDRIMKYLMEFYVAKGKPSELMLVAIEMGDWRKSWKCQEEGNRGKETAR